MATNLNSRQSGKVALPPPGQVFEWAYQAIRERNWLEASGRWAVLREAYPRHPAPWVQGAIAHMEANELEAAGALLAYARQRFSSNPNALTQSAELALRQREWSVAETFLSQAREQFPGEMETWLKSSKCAEHQGALERALEYNETARARFPDCPDAFIQYAELAMRAEHWESALARWEDVRSRFPAAAAGYLRAAEAARHLNRHQEARQLILAHQYGADLFDEVVHTKRSAGQHRTHSRLIRFLELVWTKALFNLRSEVHRNYLSYAWWLLEPLLHMTVYYVVFGLLLRRGGQNYPVFLLTGLIPWMWFSKAVSSSSGSILRGQQLMIQVGLPALVFPLVSVLQTTLKQLPVFALLFGFLWLQGFSPGYQWWGLLPVVLVHILLMTAVACAVAAVVPFVRDFGYLVPTGLMFLMFCSGVFYDYRIVAQQWQQLFLLNPVAFLLKCYREIFIEDSMPDMQALGWWGLGAAAACAVTALAYQRLRYLYPRIVME